MTTAPTQPIVTEEGTGLLRLAQLEAPRMQALPPLESLRVAAKRLDRSRQTRNELDTERAIRIWEGLLQGHCNLIDWFDSDGRRFIIAKLNTTKNGCSRGLTPRERDVALCAAEGESSKVTGYRLGISPSRVSVLLKAAMRKLGVRTKAQLVVMVHLLNGQSYAALAATPIGASNNV